ncbi:MAG TPA: hypothetical protein VFU73_12660 [Actinocrinis sp.]|nr:hypothetical protein [Actinocrinis sp.]
MSAGALAVPVAVAAAFATVGLTAAPAAAASACSQDGVAVLCVTAKQSGDVLALGFQVTQADGPGVYSVYDVDAGGGAASNAQTVGPLSARALATGSLFGQLGHCYTVYLDSAPGTSLVVGPVCL